jgi:FlaA1/EpsC-like NDP-sugar epimerase
MSSKDAVLNAFLSCFMHVGLALVLLVYLPAASVLRLLVRPLLANKQAEDLRGKVVLVTGASSGIGEVSLLRCSACMHACISMHVVLYELDKLVVKQYNNSTAIRIRMGTYVVQNQTNHACN